MRNNFRILLLEAPYSYGIDRMVVKSYFPLGLGYLASYLRENGFEIKIFQAQKDKSFYSEVIQQIKEFNPHLVGVSAMTPTYPEALNICELTKTYSKAKTVLGGSHISAVKSEVFKDSENVNFLAIGEGELTLLELVRRLAGRGKLEDVNGLIWKDSYGNIVENKPRELIEDVNKLPFPARDLIDLSRYGVHSYINFRERAATMISSRGCPFSCSFCSSFLTMGRKYRIRTAKNILAEIEELITKYKIDHVVFEDDVFSLDRKRLIEICKELLKIKRKISWYCLSRVDTIDFELAKLMKEAGCRMVNFGVESGSPEILKRIHKNISLEKAKEAIAICSKVGLRTQATFIVGFPFDTYQTMKMTLSIAKEISPTIAIFFPLIPYPGTEIFEKHLSEKLRPKNVKEWMVFNMTSITKGIKINSEFSPSYIQYISRIWAWKFYSNPYQLLRLIKSAKSWRELFYLLKSGILLILRVGKGIWLKYCFVYGNKARR